MHCFFCKQELESGDEIGRQDTCAHCGRDLKCCMQCRFYDVHAYNACREVLAERVVDKERSNFCDYFVPRGETRRNMNRSDEAKQALEALFKK